MIFKLKADHIFIQVDAKRASFYQKLFFKQVGKSRILKNYNNTEAALLHLDLKNTWQFPENKCYENFNNIKKLLKKLNVYDRYKFFRKMSKTFQWTEKEKSDYKQCCGIKSLS